MQPSRKQYRLKTWKSGFVRLIPCRWFRSWNGSHVPHTSHCRPVSTPSSPACSVCQRTGSRTAQGGCGLLPERPRRSRTGLERKGCEVKVRLYEALLCKLGEFATPKRAEADTVAKQLVKVGASTGDEREQAARRQPRSHVQLHGARPKG